MEKLSHRRKIDGACCAFDRVSKDTPKAVASVRYRPRCILKLPWLY